MENDRGAVWNPVSESGGDGKPEGTVRRRLWKAELLLLCLLLVLTASLYRLSVTRYMQAAYPLKYRELIVTYARQYDFEPSLIFALIHTESGFDPDAVSSAEAFGLMQITRDTFDWAQSRTGVEESLPVNELFTPEVNVQYGVLILSLLRQEFSDTQTMLAAYNAGIGNVRKWLANPAYSDDGITLKYIPFEETRGYVGKIPDAKRMYEALYELESNDPGI